MLTIAGGVILGGLGLLVVIALLPWVIAVLKMLCYIPYRIARMVIKGVREALAGIVESISTLSLRVRVAFLLLFGTGTATLLVALAVRH